MSGHIIKPPPDTMCGIAIDPGTGRAGMLAFGVPGPPENHPEDEPYRPQRVFIYGEKMFYRANASEIANTAHEWQYGSIFETWIMDWKAGQQTPFNMGIQVHDNFVREFAKLGMKNRQHGQSFEHGHSDPEGRELLLKEMLAPPRPKIAVLRHMTLLNGQMEDLRSSKTDPNRRDKRASETELVDALEYIAGHFSRGIYWNKPQKLIGTERDMGQEWVKKFNKWDWRLDGKKPTAVSDPLWVDWL